MGLGTRGRQAGIGQGAGREERKAKRGLLTPPTPSRKSWFAWLQGSGTIAPCCRESRAGRARETPDWGKGSGGGVTAPSLSPAAGWRLPSYWPRVLAAPSHRLMNNAGRGRHWANWQLSSAREVRARVPVVVSMPTQWRPERSWAGLRCLAGSPPVAGWSSRRRRFSLPIARLGARASVRIAWKVTAT